MFPPDIIEAFREFKRIFDPGWKMNPGKIIDANPVDGQLRLGPPFGAVGRGPPTHLPFPEDRKALSRVAIRCVGVGKCRSQKGTMCPSYMVTREEQHCTRGRARLLFEMVKGEALHDGWQSEAVRDALDLCLACKGCKGECPVHVDMAAYKAEFLSHYYANGHRRARSDYALGLVYKWARLAARAPGLANVATQTPGLRALTHGAAGLSQRRSLPPFAERTFTAAFAARPSRAMRGAPRVLLWPDTFNDHFYPHVLIAAAEVLEAAGYAVEIPPARLCCGRPLYYFGFLDKAKALLRSTLDALRPALDADVPVVGVEPSCISTFRDELCNFYGDDPTAKRLADNAFLLSDFLCAHPRDLCWPKVGGRALLHEHCHRKTFMNSFGARTMLERLGLDVDMPDTGCCGLAGPFGYERDHYDVSMAIGERVLLPKVRAADAQTLIVADGFACREQIRHATQRRALHPAEVLHAAIRNQAGRMDGDELERNAPRTATATVPLRTIALMGGIALGAAGAWTLARARAAERSER